MTLLFIPFYFYFQLTKGVPTLMFMIFSNIYNTYNIISLPLLVYF